MGKRKKNRKQQLREIQERRQRYQPNIQQRPFSLWQFLVEHDSEIFFIGCIVVALTLVYSLKHHKKSSQKVIALSSSVPQQQINELRRNYPQGFRVFVLAKHDVVALNVDTLPSELNINWNVSRIISLTKEEIRFQIGPISYQSKSVAPSLMIKLPRRQGKTSNVADINGLEITVELLGEYNTGIFCALGFKKKY